MSDMKWVSFQPNQKRKRTKREWDQMVTTIQLEEPGNDQMVQIPRKDTYEDKKTSPILKQEEQTLLQQERTREKMSIPNLLNPTD